MNEWIGGQFVGLVYCCSCVVAVIGPKQLTVVDYFEIDTDRQIAQLFSAAEVTCQVNGEPHTDKCKPSIYVQNRHTLLVEREINI